MYNFLTHVGKKHSVRLHREGREKTASKARRLYNTRQKNTAIIILVLALILGGAVTGERDITNGFGRRRLRPRQPPQVSIPVVSIFDERYFPIVAAAIVLRELLVTRLLHLDYALQAPP